MCGDVDCKNWKQKQKLKIVLRVCVVKGHGAQNHEHINAEPHIVKQRTSSTWIDKYSYINVYINECPNVNI